MTRPVQSRPVTKAEAKKSQFDGSFTDYTKALRNGMEPKGTKGSFVTKNEAKDILKTANDFLSHTHGIDPKDPKLGKARRDSATKILEHFQTASESHSPKYQDKATKEAVTKFMAKVSRIAYPGPKGGMPNVE